MKVLTIRAIISPEMAETEIITAIIMVITMAIGDLNAPIS